MALPVSCPVQAGVGTPPLQKGTNGAIYVLSGGDNAGSWYSAAFKLSDPATGSFVEQDSAHRPSEGARVGGKGGAGGDDGQQYYRFIDANVIQDVHTWYDSTGNNFPTNNFDTSTDLWSTASNHPYAKGRSQDLSDDGHIAYTSVEAIAGTPGFRYDSTTSTTTGSVLATPANGGAAYYGPGGLSLSDGSRRYFFFGGISTGNWGLYGVTTDVSGNPTLVAKDTYVRIGGRPILHNGKVYCAYYTSAPLNKMTNGYFETDASSVGTSNYSLTAGATATRDTTQAHSGAASLKVVNTAQSQGARLAITGGSINGQTTITFWVKGNVGGETIDCYVADSGTTFYFSSGGLSTTQAVTLTTSWQQVTLAYSDFHIGADASLVIRNTVAGAATFFVDDVVWIPDPSTAAGGDCKVISAAYGNMPTFSTATVQAGVVGDNVALAKVKGVLWCLYVLNTSTSILRGRPLSNDGSTWGPEFTIWDVSGMAGAPTFASPSTGGLPCSTITRSSSEMLGVIGVLSSGTFYNEVTMPSIASVLPYSRKRRNTLLRR